MTVRWGEFALAAPEIGEKGRALIHQFGIGLGFLATVRPDGGPRVHPFCPTVTDEGLWAFLIDSPKTNDLLRDPRFALHAFPPEAVDDEFYVTGTAHPVDDPETRAQVLAVHQGSTQDDHRLFEFRIATAMLAVYRHRGDWPPTYSTWRAPE